MKENILLIKSIIVSIGGYMCTKLGIVAQLIGILMISSIIDYVSGMLASAITGKLSSKIGIRGILKKLSYFIVVAVALIVDWLFLNFTQQLGFNQQLPMMVSSMVCVWLILNELVSVLENIQRSGVPIPTFLTLIIDAVIKKVDDNKYIK